MGSEEEPYGNVLTAGDRISDTAWIPRYLPSDAMADATLEVIPHLVRAAWDHALAFPELGGEGVEDLIADLKEIVARERVNTAAAARVKAMEEARVEVEHIATQALRSASRAMEEGLAGIVAEGVADGIDPVGGFVYLLWEHKGDPVPIYVGKSTNILARLGDHMRAQDRKHRIRWVTLIRCKDGRAMDKTEWRLISRYRPELNILGIPASA